MRLAAFPLFAAFLLTSASGTLAASLCIVPASPRLLFSARSTKGGSTPPPLPETSGPRRPR